MYLYMSGSVGELVMFSFRESMHKYNFMKYLCVMFYYTKYCSLYLLQASLYCLWGISCCRHRHRYKDTRMHNHKSHMLPIIDWAYDCMKIEAIQHYNVNLNSIEASLYYLLAGTHYGAVIWTWIQCFNSQKP